MELEDGEGWRRVRDEEEGGPILGRSVGYEMVDLGRVQG